MTFLTILGVTEMVCSFKLVLEEKAGKEIPESEKFLANNLALSDAEDDTSGPLNRGGIANLAMLTTLIVIRQMSRESRFWEVMDQLLYNTEV